MGCMLACYPEEGLHTCRIAFVPTLDCHQLSLLVFDGEYPREIQDSKHRGARRRSFVSDGILELVLTVRLKQISSLVGAAGAGKSTVLI